MSDVDGAEEADGLGAAEVPVNVHTDQFVDAIQQLTDALVLLDEATVRAESPFGTTEIPATDLVDVSVTINGGPADDEDDEGAAHAIGESINAISDELDRHGL